ncbi:MAG: hypothetical protein ACJAT5_000277 [Lentimonas sp.]|jgi:hypothetical protein
MSDQQKPQTYFIYGIPDSGRRKILFDLIESGIDHDEPVLYFRPEEEPRSSFDEQLEALKNVSIVTWTLSGTTIKHSSIKSAPRKVIFLAPRTCDPADAAEALKQWTDGNQCQIARIITVVHCAFLSQNENAFPWFDACIHFSDVVLLGRRETVPNKWVKDFEVGYQKQYCPARFLLVKKGLVANPFEVLEPEARRQSLYFDELIPIEDDEFDGDEAPEDTQPDKYIKRLENGQRACRIPDILALITAAQIK